MKKIYFLLLSLLTLLSLDASAKTATFKVDRNGTTANVGFIDFQNGYNYVQITDEGVSINLDSYSYLQLQADSGYLMDEISCKSGYSIRPGVSNYSLDTSSIEDGDVVTIKLVVEPSKSVVFKGAPKSYYVSYNYNEVKPNDEGVLTISDVAPYTSIYVYACEGYRLLEVKDQTQRSYSIYSGNCSLYSSDLSYDANGVCTLEVNSVDASTIKKSKFTYKAVGTKATSINMYNQSTYSYVYPSEEVRTEEFEPGESYFIGANNNIQLYKVEVNGSPLTAQYGTYTYYPQDNDELVIYTDFPDGNATLKFSFEGTADPGIISEFRCDNQMVQTSEWKDGFTAKLGQTVNLTFNNEDYEDVTVKLNGEEIDHYRYQNTFTEEKDYNFVISGKGLTPFSVSVATNVPDALVLKDRNGNVYPIDKTKDENVITVLRSNNVLYITAEDGYKVDAVVVNGNEESYFQYGVYINSNSEIEVSIKKIERNNNAVVYLEDTQWGYLSMVLSPNDYNLRKEITLNPGYNFISFGSFDLPIGLSATDKDYNSATVYLNEKELTYNYGVYEGLENLANGDVIKVYTSAKAPFKLEYEIDANAEVSVTHDHISSIENPSVHNVLPGTQVHITPSTVYGTRASSGVEVKLNNEKVGMDADGRYSFAVNGDSKVVVTPTTTGVDELGVGSETDCEVYNLQGVKINRPIEMLPPGIYIINGQKRVIK